MLFGPLRHSSEKALYGICGGLVGVILEIEAHGLPLLKDILFVLAIVQRLILESNPLEKKCIRRLQIVEI